MSKVTTKVGALGVIFEASNLLVIDSKIVKSDGDKWFRDEGLSENGGGEMGSRRPYIYERCFFVRRKKK
ncbi:MAG: hypothetical protein U1B83_08625 [Candidatus Cloacimonadaceae bacterium]|nr:hypothetical protein [Candidatus Cloacimonadaceae bacterium]